MTPKINKYCTAFTLLLLPPPLFLQPQTQRARRGKGTGDSQLAYLPPFNVMIATFTTCSCLYELNLLTPRATPEFPRTLLAWLLGSLSYNAASNLSLKIFCSPSIRFRDASSSGSSSSPPFASSSSSSSASSPTRCKLTQEMMEGRMKIHCPKLC